jgi:hypothetical protein
LAENEAQLELKKRARRRLVGAPRWRCWPHRAADGDGPGARNRSTQDIQVRIPSPGFAGPSLPASSGQAGGDTDAPAAGRRRKPSRSATTKPKSPEAEPKAVKPRPSRKRRRPAKSVPQNGGKPPEPRACARRRRKAAEPKKPEMAEAKPAAEASAVGGATRRLSRAGNVRNLTAKLKQQGYNFYTEALPSPAGQPDAGAGRPLPEQGSGRGGARADQAASAWTAWSRRSKQGSDLRSITPCWRSSPRRLLGAWRGLVSEVLALAAWVAAFLAARAWAPGMAPHVGGEWLKEPALQYAAAFAVIVGGAGGGALLRLAAVASCCGPPGWAPLDRFLGALFGIARGLVVPCCVVLVAG